MKRTGVLADHKRNKKKLTPPLLQALGDKYAPYSWTRQLVPEAIWIWLLLESCGVKKGNSAAAALGRVASSVSAEKPSRLFCKTSSFAVLSDRERTQLLKEIGDPELEIIRDALSVFFEVFPDSPLVFLDDGRAPNESARHTFASSLNDLYDRNGRPTALTLATVTWMALDQEKLSMSGEMLDKVIEDFKNIIDYPQSERSKRAASSFRAGAPMMLMMGEEGFEHDEAWQQYFWSRVGMIGPCMTSFSDPPAEMVPQDDPIGWVIFQYRNAARAELALRLKEWRLDLNNIDMQEVVSALLSRQTALAADLALAPSIWNPNIAPIILRSMADVFIAMAWILKENSNDRARIFIEDGLGAIKLEIAHRKKAAEDGEKSEKEDAEKYIDMLQSWVDSQRLDQLVEVNLGSWSGMTVRAMAEEAGFIDFYNYVYQPFSSTVHSNWFHVSNFNSVTCENPAHRHHRLGKIREVQIDPHWLYLAAKYLQKSFSHFDETIGRDPLDETSFELLIQMLEQVEPGTEETDQP